MQECDTLANAFLVAQQWVFVFDAQDTIKALHAQGRYKSTPETGAVPVAQRNIFPRLREVQTGFECGITIADFTDFQQGDVIEVYRRERET